MVHGLRIILGSWNKAQNVLKGYACYTTWFLLLVGVFCSLHTRHSFGMAFWYSKEDDNEKLNRCFKEQTL